MLKAHQISYKINGRNILSQVDLQVSPGSFTAILGANGAGKSTLLKTLSGDIANFSGAVDFNGMALSTFKSQSLALVRAVLPQSVEVHFPFTVLEIVQLGAIPLNKRPKDAAQLALKSLDKLGLIHLSNRIYNTLSGGEKQKVQLARVITQITNSPELNKYLLLDEPTSSLDIACQHQILEEAKQLTLQNIGVIAILHDLNQAGQYADQVLMLKQGKTVAFGPTKEVFTQENIEDTYGHPVVLHHLNAGVPYVIPMIGSLKNISINGSIRKTKSYLS